jgi:hypothetical protein
LECGILVMWDEDMFCCGGVLGEINEMLKSRNILMLDLYLCASVSSHLFIDHVHSTSQT